VLPDRHRCRDHAGAPDRRLQLHAGHGLQDAAGRFRPGHADGCLIALLGLPLAGAALGAAFGWRHGALFAVAAGLGLAFQHSRFGFTGAYRALFLRGETAGVRAQLLLVALTATLFAAAFALLPATRGFVFPTGLALLVGAFLFGIGMQLGGGCGSGTLQGAGGGETRLWLTLASFVVGATLAAWQWELWRDWPALPPTSLAQSLGAAPALAATLAVLGALYLAARRGEPITGPGDPLRGPWPKLWGAVAIAVLSLGTLILAGRPWAITAAFPLWGSRLVEAAGLDDPAFWPWWEEPTRAEAILRPVLADRVTVMDIGVIAGAWAALRLSGGRFTRITGGEAAASVVGGLLLGVGAMLATGCNISALLAGIASFSLHGWAWAPAALAGNAVGVRLRPLFRLN
jgi:uncharacterized membrane protein YedE/YeeE